MMNRGICLKGLRPAELLAALALSVPSIGLTAPSSKSEATIDACLENTTTAFVCSSKELSNVVLQCDDGEGSQFWVKADDLDEAGLDNPFQASFVCELTDEEGTVLATGTVVNVFVKSGSKKAGPGEAPGAPFGGIGEAFFGPALCSDAPAECPDTGDDGGTEDPPADPTAQ